MPLNPRAVECALLHQAERSNFFTCERMSRGYHA